MERHSKSSHLLPATWQSVQAIGMKKQRRENQLYLILQEKRLGVGLRGWKSYSPINVYLSTQSQVGILLPLILQINLFQFWYLNSLAQSTNFFMQSSDIWWWNGFIFDTLWFFILSLQFLTCRSKLLILLPSPWQERN